MQIQNKPKTQRDKHNKNGQTQSKRARQSPKTQKHSPIHRKANIYRNNCSVAQMKKAIPHTDETKTWALNTICNKSYDKQDRWVSVALQRLGITG